MIKGARKQMIVVRMGNSRYFDEAYFVLREEMKKNTHKNKDILSEANRIISEMIPDMPHTPPKNKRQWIFFAVGGFCGALLSVIMTLLLV